MIAAKFLLAAALLASCADTSAPALPAATETINADSRLLATVIKVIDGDTIDVVIDGTETRIRILGIDTPESVSGFRDPECFGQEASNYTKQMLPAGTRVRLTGDIERRDKYGRLLAYVYREQDDLFINLDLLKGGYATDLAFEPNTTYAEVFAEAAAKARTLKLGLWGLCGGPDRALN